MGRSYKPLFVLLANKGLKKTDLRELAGISSGTLARFAKGEIVSTDVLEKICLALECQIGDIVEVVKDEPKKSKKAK
jgi:DNA-binding Xre family transcriptional regulator